MKNKKTDSAADEIQAVEAKPRSRKKAASEAGASSPTTAPKAAKKQAAKKAAGSVKAAAEEPLAEKNGRAKKGPASKGSAKTEKGRDLVAETPAAEEVADVLHETPDEALAEQESYAEDAADEAFSAEEDEEDEAPVYQIEDDEKKDESEEAEPDPDELDDDELEDEEEEDGEDDQAVGEDEETDSAPAREERSGNPERLQKVLAKAGVASRRAAEEMILAGRVQLNGKIVTELGTKAELGRDHIRVDGKLIHGAERLRYFVLNKPKGYVTTVSDPEHRPTVMQFFSGERERLYPVGRLDYLSEGLLLVTNDGELANKLTKAANGVEKTYLVKVAGTPSEELLDQLREGMVIERGRLGSGAGRVRTAPAQIRKVREGDNPWYEVILIEGRNREIRKLFEEIGHHVEKIRRVGYGPLVLDLEPGKLRELTDEEVHKLQLTAEGKLKPRRRRGPAPAQLERKAGRTVDHERYAKGNRTPRRTAAGSAEKPGVKRDERPALYDRPDFSELSAPARKPDRDFGDRGRAPRPAVGSGRDTSTGQATGRRDFKPERPAFGDRRPDRPHSGRPPSDRPARAERSDQTPSRLSDRSERFERSEGQPAKKPFKSAGKPAGRFDKPGNFDKPFNRDRKPFDRDRAPGRGREEHKPFRPREEFRERQPEDFGAEPIPRTPGFRVEEVQEAPRPSRPPRMESFSARGPARPGNKPFRSEGARPSSNRPSGDRPFRKPEGRSASGRPASDRPSPARPGGRPAAGKPFGAGKPYESRPARPFREREDERGDRPRPSAPRRSFGDAEERPRGPRPGGRPAGPTRSSGFGRPSGPGRPRTGDRPAPAGRPRPFDASGPHSRPKAPGSRPKKEEGAAPRVKNRWRNSFEGKNKGRPKPKPKKES